MTISSTEVPFSIESLVKSKVDKLLASYQEPEDIIGDNGLLKHLTTALVESLLEQTQVTRFRF